MGDRNYGAIRDSRTAIAQIEKIIAGGKEFAFDIEAGYTGDDKVGVALQQFHPDYIVVGISFTTSTAWARYIPFAHDDGGNVDNIIEVARALWRLLRTGRGVAHNAAYELKGMARWFRETLWFDQEVRESRGLFPILSDTMIEVWYAACYDPIRVGKDLKSVAKAAFGMEMTDFMDLFPSTDSDLGPATKRGKTKVVRFNTRNSYAPQVIDYACEDSVAALMVHQKHYAEVKDEFMFRSEMSLLPVLVEMEMGPVDSDGVARGNMMFDWPEIQRRQIEVTEFAEKMNEEIQTDLGNRLGRTININLASVPQLSKVLFEERPEGLGLPVKQRSEKTGQPSTSDDALRVIAKTDPIIKKILQYRQVTKLNSSYLTKFLKELNYSGTGVVFPNHNQAGALTGRMSVDQVSYQQWPKPYHFELSGGLSFDLNFRDLFVAQEDHRILGFDYANVELRVAGALSGEDKIIDAFNEGRDLHKTTASAAFGMAFDEVDKKHRGFGKTLNFQILYGGGAAAVSDALTAQGDPVSKEQAQDMIDGFMRGYPKLAAWINDQQVRGREQKEVFTHFRRKFTIWEHYDHREWIRAKGDRMAVNAPVQGTAADIIKIAMVRAQRKIKEKGWQDVVRLTLTVHDALEFLVHKSISTQEVIDLIDPAVNFPVPGFPLEIRADWHEGYRWGSVAEVKLDHDKKITGYAIEDVDIVYPTFDAVMAAVEGMRSEEGQKDTENGILLTSDPVEEEQEWFHSAEYWAEHSQLVTITLDHMPDEVQWESFNEYLNARPGHDLVRLETPEGILTFDTTHKLTDHDQPRISIILGGAAVSVGAKEADPDAVMGAVL